jgi:hypothetical protein
MSGANGPIARSADTMGRSSSSCPDGWRDVALKCLKCGTLVADDRIEPCPAVNCGAREWEWVNEPSKPLRWSKMDLKFLKSIHICGEA